MYRVIIQNGNTQLAIHSPLPDPAQKLASGKIVREPNSISSFTFTIYPHNRGYDMLRSMNTVVSVYNMRRQRYEFVGRVLDVTPQMDSSGIVSKNVVCEDRLAYLNDSTQPFAAMTHYTGDDDRTGLEEFIDVVLGNHNAMVEPHKRIYRGSVTVNTFKSADNVTKQLNYQKTWEVLYSKLVGSFGGFLILRESNGVLYLDYLESVGTTRTTAITLGRNMKSASRNINPTGIITRLIPLGAKLGDDTEERLGIESVNNGIPYIEAPEYVEEYGYIYGPHYWDDVTSASNLKAKAEVYLAEHNGISISDTITALDLSLLGLDADDFVLYDRYPVYNPLMNVNDILQIAKQVIDVVQPLESTFKMGDTVKRLSDAVVETQGGIQGAPGKNSYTYFRYSANPDGADMTEVPAEETLYIGIAVTQSSVAPTSPSDYTWSKYVGKDGKDGTSVNILGTYSSYSELLAAHPVGEIGDAYIISGDLYVWTGADNGWVNVGRIQGDAGASSYLYVRYSENADGSGMVAAPTASTKYIGVCVSTSETAPEDHTLYTWSKYAGEDGKDGNGIESIAEHYARSTSNTTAPTTWQDSPPTLTETYRYLWNYETVTYTNGDVVDMKKRVIGVYGDSGKDGVSITGVTNYYLATSIGDGITISASGWTEEAQNVTAEKKYLWNYEVVHYSDGNSTPTTPCIIGTYGDKGEPGKDGKGVTRVTPYYAKGASTTTAPSDPSIPSWTVKAPDISVGEYLWCAYYILYTDETTDWTAPFYLKSADNLLQSDSEPDNPTVGTLWLDTSSTPYSLMRWNGTAWVTVSDYSGQINSIYSYIDTSVSDVKKSNEELSAYVQKQTVSKAVYETFTETVRNILSMDADGTTMIFEKINEAISELDGKQQSNYNSILKYIRFEDGNIILGEKGNAITLKLENDILGFYQNGVSIAYFSDNQLYVGNATIRAGGRLTLGDFGFVPRADGSLTFLKVGGSA